MIGKILTLKEIAKYFEKTAYRFAAEGKLPGFKLGGSWRFKKGSWRFKKVDIETWVEDKKTDRSESQKPDTRRHGCMRL